MSLVTFHDVDMHCPENMRRMKDALTSRASTNDASMRQYNPNQVDISYVYNLIQRIVPLLESFPSHYYRRNVRLTLEEYDTKVKRNFSCLAISYNVFAALPQVDLIRIRSILKHAYFVDSYPLGGYSRRVLVRNPNGKDHQLRMICFRTDLLEKHITFTPDGRVKDITQNDSFDQIKIINV